jgi:hypothetical protein
MKSFKFKIVELAEIFYENENSVIFLKFEIEWLLHTWPSPPLPNPHSKIMPGHIDLYTGCS